MVALYPSIPIEIALECVRKKLLNDDTLASRTDWNADDIIKLLRICLETHFKQSLVEYLHKLMELQLENQFQDH